MFGQDKILEYGIAVNYLGNYRREGGFLNGMTRELTGGLLNLQSLLVGGGLVGAFAMFGSKVMQVGTMMEQNFANLKATLGNTTEALKQLEWARVKGATTPFEIPEVNQALSMMHMMGFAKNDEQRENTFDSVGDFAALRGYGFADVLSRVARASFGNWEALGDTFGIRKQTIGDMARGRVEKNPNSFTDEEKASLDGWIKTVKEGENGTQEMKEAIVSLIGILGKGGLEAKLNTVGGIMSNLSDIVSNFWMNLVGYSQVQGTFYGNIKETLKYVNDEFSKTLEVQKELKTLADGTTVEIQKEVNAIDMLGNIGKGVGQILSGVFVSVDNMARSTTDFLIGYVQKLNKFMSDYKNNIAPIILFLALMKIEVEYIIKSIWQGFRDGFAAFGGTAKLFFGWLIDIIEYLGILDENSNAVAYSIGLIAGAIVGIKVLGIVANPFFKLAGGAIDAAKYVGTLWTKMRTTRAVTTATTAVGGFAGATNVATASTWGLNAAMAVNPFVIAAVAIAALIVWIGYLVTHWDEVGASMQDVSDSTLIMLSAFAPVIGIPLLLAKHWKDFKNIFDNLWSGISDRAELGWLRFKDKIIDPWLASWDLIYTGFGIMWDKIMNKLTWLKPLIEGAKDGWESLTNWSFSDLLGDWSNGSENFARNAKNELDKYKEETGRIDPKPESNEKYYTPPTEGGILDAYLKGKKESEDKNMGTSFEGANITIQLPNVTNPEDFATFDFSTFSDISDKSGK